MQYPANTINWTKASFMLAQRLRRCTNINPALVQRLVFLGVYPMLHKVVLILALQWCPQGLCWYLRYVQYSVPRVVYSYYSPQLVRLDVSVLPWLLGGNLPSTAQPRVEQTVILKTSISQGSYHGYWQCKVQVPYCLMLHSVLRATVG